MFLNTVFAVLIKIVISQAVDDFFDLSADDHLGHKVNARSLLTIPNFKP